MRRRRLLVAGAVAALGILVGAPAPPADTSEPFTIYAAASLVDLLDSLRPVLEGAAGGPVRVSTASSATLARQILNGAPGDLFVSASERWMDAVEDAGLLAGGDCARRNWLANTLVCVVPADAAWVPDDLPALADPRVKTLALGAGAVPVGRYAREAIRNAGVTLPGTVVTGLNARDTLAKVAIGGADAGIVYATDVRLEPRVRVAFAVDPALHSPIVYPAAGLTHSGRGETCARVLAALRSAEAQRILQTQGFTLAESSRA